MDTYSVKFDHVYFITLFFDIYLRVNFNNCYMHLREWVNKLVAKCDCVPLLIVKIISQRRSFDHCNND